MRIFLTRNKRSKFSEGLVYIWMVENKDSLYLNDGVWEIKEEEGNRAIVIQPVVFEREVIRMGFPKVGSIQEIFGIDIDLGE